MKLDTRKIKDFILSNYKYIILAVLFLALIIVLVSLMSGEDKKKKEETTSKEPESAIETQVGDTLEVDAYPEVNALVTKYLSAWAASDVDMLATLVQPLDKEAELEEIALNKDYIESMNNIKCYTKPGPVEDSYIVYAYYEMKFNGPDTYAPGLVNLFVFKEKEEYFIWDYKEYIVAGDDVTGLLADVNAKYEELVAADPLLKDCIEGLAAKEPFPVPETTAATTAPQETTVATTAPQETTTEPQTQAAATDKVYVDSNVNVRSGPSTDSEKLGVILSGTDYTRTGQEGEWSIIDYNGKKGYVKTEFLKVR